MAIDIVNEGAIGAGEPPHTVRPHFAPWPIYDKSIDNMLLHGWSVRQFATRVNDVARGTATMIEIQLQAHLDEDARNDADDPRDAPQPLLSVAALNRLLRLALSSNEMLAIEADRLMEWAQEHCKNGGAA